jgi:hypothetical protein
VVARRIGLAFVRRHLLRNPAAALQYCHVTASGRRASENSGTAGMSQRASFIFCLYRSQSQHLHAFHTIRCPSNDWYANELTFVILSRGTCELRHREEPWGT